jgi:hypothetical protein
MSIEERPQEPLQGKLDAFWETGTEGIHWSFCEDGKPGYSGLHSLADGDIVRVFNDAARKVVIWEGTIKLENQSHWEPFFCNPPHGQQQILGCWVHGLQEGEKNIEDWARMFLDGKPAELIPARKQGMKP